MKLDPALPASSAKNSKPRANNPETGAGLNDLFATPNTLPKLVTADRSQLAGLAERRWWRAQPTTTSATANGPNDVEARPTTRSSQPPIKKKTLIRHWHPTILTSHTSRATKHAAKH
jgi:hypothetical protein